MVVARITICRPCSALSLKWRCPVGVSIWFSSHSFRSIVTFIIGSTQSRDRLDRIDRAAWDDVSIGLFFTKLATSALYSIWTLYTFHYPCCRTFKPFLNSLIGARILITTYIGYTQVTQLSLKPIKSLFFYKLAVHSDDQKKTSCIGRVWALGQYGLILDCIKHTGVL